MLHVDVGAFEGPLDLLLQLIRKNEIQIEDIPIAEITEAYVSVLEDGRSVRQEEMGDFLVLASELLYIKSRMLLPVEEEPEEEDPREVLIQRLRAYEAFLEVAKTLEYYEKEGAVKLTKLPSDLSGYTAEPIEITREVGELYLAFREALRVRALEETSRDTIGEMIEREEYEVETAIAKLMQAPIETPTPLADFVISNSVGEWIAVFIAMLELIKRNILSVIVKNKQIILHRREAYQ